MDPQTLAWLIGGGVDPMIGAPMPAPAPAIAPVIPAAAAAAPPVIAPTAGMPPAQSFEPTNPGNPMMMGGAGETYRSEPMRVPPAAAPTSLGAALEPGNVPLPQPRPANAPGAPTGGTDSLLNTLKGVKAPEAPTAQKVSTPHAPQVAKLQGGALFDLLASLGIGPQQALPGLKLPSTLGQALGGR